MTLFRTCGQSVVTFQNTCKSHVRYQETIDEGNYFPIMVPFSL